MTTPRTREEKLALLNETAALYNLGNRSVNLTNRFPDANGNTPSCLYSPGELTPGCAVGRLIADKALCAKLDQGMCIAGTSKSFGVASPVVFNSLPPEVKNYGQLFLRRLQEFHDNSEFWSETGMSIKGADALGSMVDELASGAFDLDKYD